MVPGSTLMYGSSFCSTIFSPRDLKSLPSDAVVIPLPSPEATPPVTKMYLGCGLTTASDASRRLRRDRRFGSRILDPSRTGASRLGEQLLGVRRGRLARLEPGEHARQFAHPLVVAEDLHGRDAVVLAHPHVVIGETR